MQIDTEVGFLHKGDLTPSVIEKLPARLQDGTKDVALELDIRLAEHPQRDRWEFIRAKLGWKYCKKQ